MTTPRSTNPASSTPGANNSSRQRPIIITGGGTAGHTNPGIAVAQALVAGGLARNRVHFIGGARGNEATLVGDAGFTIDLLPGRGIQRKLSLQNIGSIAGLLAGFVKGFAIVAKRRPAAVLCLGGYAAFAASAAAVLLRVPLVITEQNARASAVNRLFGRFAKVCALPFPDTDLPKPVLTGNPIRADILSAVEAADRATARAGIAERASADGATHNFGDRVLVAVWAGSLGATKINQSVRDLASLWADRADIVLYHVIGRRDWPEFGPASDAAQIEGDRTGSAADESQDGLLYLRVEYENNMSDLLVGADLAVCRAGASTVTELAVAGLPAILVPLPTAPRDHQRANTAEVAAAGGAIVLNNEDLSGTKLAELLEPLVIDDERRAAMSAATASVARPNAAADVAGLLLDAGGMTTEQAAQ
ncbi:MAG: UDP-N-acetylglucosamine--N-acetylmuramyl-(pentapeptide) pyrophosphoryl-undecaprenol N-acetylglucosamine transferase [Acidimicrobiales bacterium]